jgi:ABC-type Na+ transport system ATPase subunit NatA
MIEVENLTKRYGDRTAVDGVSFQVHPGTVTGFLGPNGAPEAARLRTLLNGPGITVTADSPDALRVRGLATDQIGRTAWQAHIPVLELSVARGSLEEAFMQATNDSTEFISARQEAVR